MRELAKTFEESRYCLILARDLDYADISGLNSLLLEISKLLVPCSQAILNSQS